MRFKKKFEIKMVLVIKVLIVLLLSFNLLNCSEKKDSSKSVLNSLNGHQSKILSDFLDKYIKYYNAKNADGIVSLYSSNPVNTLEKKELLKEMFDSTDTIKVSYKDLEIKEANDQKIIFKIRIDKEITLGRKIINDSRNAEYILINENDKFLLSSMRTLSIIK
ncbi:hypothetical protein KA977_12610 [Candidatus Dependentiae bacterium]|nr:hypothetical protein [Candidatus Dependentiae bacterium]